MDDEKKVPVIIGPKDNIGSSIPEVIANFREAAEKYASSLTLALNNFPALHSMRLHLSQLTRDKDASLFLDPADMMAPDPLKLHSTHYTHPYRLMKQTQLPMATEEVMEKKISDAVEAMLSADRSDMASTILFDSWAGTESLAMREAREESLFSSAPPKERRKHSERKRQHPMIPYDVHLIPKDRAFFGVGKPSKKTMSKRRKANKAAGKARHR